MGIFSKILKSTPSSVVIFLAFLIALNFLVSQRAVYFDLTEGGIYTTSETTKNILKNLKNDVSVNFYISKDLPADLLNVKTQIADFMNQYQEFGGSKLKVSYNEPENTDEKVRELAQKGIPQIQFNVMEKDKYEVRQGFFGVEIVSQKGDKEEREIIPIIQSVDSWEYDFISTVYSVSRESKETIAFLEGHGEKDLRLEDLKKSYDIQKVRIASKEEEKGFFVEEASESGEGESKKKFINPVTLIIAGATEEILKEEILVIDDYIKNGRNVIALSDSVAPDINMNLQAKEIKNGLNELTEKYGIKINNDLVYDAANANITYRQGFFSVSAPYPYWVKTLPENFGDYPSLSSVQSVMFPWVSSLSLSEKDDYEAKPLISSTSKAGVSSGSYNLLPNSYISFSQVSQKTLAAFSKPKDKNSKSGKLFVFGDSDFVSPEFIGQMPDNQTFFINLVDSVSNSAGLASIRSKNIASRPIKEINESEKNYWKFASIFAGAILINVYGFFRIMGRKKRK